MKKVFEIYIRTTPERLWEAITDSEIRSKHHFGSRVSSDWTPGSRYEMSHPAATGLVGEGENLEVDPPRRLVQSMVALWSDEVKNESTSRVTWEIEPIAVRHPHLEPVLRDPARPGPAVPQRRDCGSPGLDQPAST